MFLTIYRDEKVLLRKQRVASLSRDEEEAGGRKRRRWRMRHTVVWLWWKEPKEPERGRWEEERCKDRVQLRRQKRRRNTRGEPVSPSPWLIYLNLRNSVSCRGLYIGQAQVASAKSLEERGRNARGEYSRLSLLNPPVINQKAKESILGDRTCKTKDPNLDNWILVSDVLGV